MFIFNEIHNTGVYTSVKYTVIKNKFQNIVRGLFFTNLNE